jgi:glucan phosphoethanolaminetransferase (alkaline phosphatase superfamily)
MIQRIQSIYLGLAIVCGILTFFLPFAHFYSGDVKLAEYVFTGVLNVQSETFESSGPFSFPAFVFCALVVLIPSVSLAMYKNRLIQMRLVRLGFLVSLGFVVYLLFAADKINATLFESEAEVLYHAGFYMPVASLVFYFLALRGIKKDEALVKSLDRIR